MQQPIERYTLSEFLQDYEKHLARLRETGRPEVLTVEGQPRVVMQDAAAYEKLLQALDDGEAHEIVRTELEALDRGAPAIPVEAVLHELRDLLGIDAREANS
jgi:PHD/YefM family antitoxin component YafN of YafNO toxin-antitoxin module